MKLKTKFGNANVNCDGYYTITSAKEGNKGKYLHRLIYEDYHGVLLLPNVHIHHIDNNKLNNDVENLVSMYKSEHHKLHNGEINPMQGKNHELDSMVSISKYHNSSGYFRVTIEKGVRAKQGFTYRYRYYDENGKHKSIRSVDIKRLEEKVKSKGLEWIKLEDT